MRHVSNKVLFYIQDGTETTYLRFLASNAEAGSIIGKGGTTISDFQSRSNARIQLSRTIDEVLEAVELILTKLLNEVILNSQ